MSTLVNIPKFECSICHRSDKTIMIRCESVNEFGILVICDKCKRMKQFKQMELVELGWCRRPIYCQITLEVGETYTETNVP